MVVEGRRVAMGIAISGGISCVIEYSASGCISEPPGRRSDADAASVTQIEGGGIDVDLDVSGVRDESGGANEYVGARDNPGGPAPMSPSSERDTASSFIARAAVVGRPGAGGGVGADWERLGGARPGQWHQSITLTAKGL